MRISALTGGLFKKDDNWRLFENKISQIKQNRKRGLAIPPKLSFSIPIVDSQNGMQVSPNMELDFKNAKMQELDTYKAFTGIIDEADELLKNVERTDIPYFIFVDELEAYFGEDKVFKRDLRLIRDLIFTTKKINLILNKKSNAKTKIICSVRSEIINSIYRFIVPKELNKIVSGFEIPLIWDYTTTNSYAHPIMRILISRINYGEKKQGNELTNKEIIEKWFPEKINGKNAANYILDNTWCKPRDIVRLVACAQNCLASNNESFSQKTIDFSRKRYSVESFVELKEELRALYSPNEIEIITQSLRGFHRIFSLEEIEKRVESLYKGTFLEKKLRAVLTDLYRIGIIGNTLVSARTYRWQHKGDDGIILDNNWSIVIHPALISALSVNKRQDSVTRKLPIKNERLLKAGDRVKIKIDKITQYFAVGHIQINSKKVKASVHISEISEEFVDNIEDYLECGLEYDAIVLSWDKERRKWNLSLKAVDYDQ